MLFDIEERKEKWERVPLWVYLMFFFLILTLSLLVAFSILWGAENWKQALAGAFFSLLSALYSTFFFRGEYSKEDIFKTFLNSLLFALVIFLVSGFVIMFLVLLGPHIARGFRIKAMKLLLWGFQQVITTYLLTSPAFSASIAIIRTIVKK